MATLEDQENPRESASTPEGRVGIHWWRGNVLKAKPEFEYREAGSWAQHYSTIRMVLATFWLSTSILIFTVEWYGGKFWEIFIPVAMSIAAWAAAAVFMLYFTW